MKVYKLSQYKDPQMDKEDFFSMFDMTEEELKKDIEIANEKKKHEIVNPPDFRDEILTLYRGFSYLPRPEDEQYVLNPDKSEQGVLWFTHDLMTVYDPLDYATSHGKYLLTYPLQVKKHYQKICYDNSDECYERIPEEINKRADGLNNCSYYMGYELPNGWYFSYKMEKFIVCENSIIVDSSMIKL